MGSSPFASSSAVIISDFGGLPEWSKGADCKSAGDAYSGSNPLPSTRKDGIMNGNLNIAGVAQLVERQPSKLNVAGSNPVTRSAVPAAGARLVFGEPVPSEEESAQVAQ